ncbi:MAG: hypothetical protein ACRD47_04835, partial [Nitrososphaeraceae archaeon]
RNSVALTTSCNVIPISLNLNHTYSYIGRFTVMANTWIIKATYSKIDWYNEYTYLSLIRQESYRLRLSASIPGLQKPPI